MYHAVQNPTTNLTSCHSIPNDIQMKGYCQVLCYLCLKIQFGLLKVRKENRGDATFDPLVDNDFNTLFIRMRCYTILNVPLK